MRIHAANLTLERRNQEDETPQVGPVQITPPIGEDYWTYRVVLGTDPHQAVLGFPKFDTIGIGFAVEDDWNTNLPYTSSTDQIVRHIWHNRGSDDISRNAVTKAVSMIQEAARADRGDDKPTQTPARPRVLRFAVPVDDAWHAIGSGPVVHVDCRTGENDVVQVWTLECEPLDNVLAGNLRSDFGRYVRVFGTGHSIPAGASHIGTALTAGGALVWHVFERSEDDGE